MSLNAQCSSINLNLSATARFFIQNVNALASGKRDGITSLTSIVENLKDLLNLLSKLVVTLHSLHVKVIF